MPNEFTADSQRIDVNISNNNSASRVRASYEFAPARLSTHVGHTASTKPISDGGRSSTHISAGYEIGGALNLSNSVERSISHHDSTFDTPLMARAIGIFEAHTLLTTIVKETGGDMRQYTLGGLNQLISEHPNIVKQNTLNRFQSGIQKLQSIVYEPPQEIIQAQQAIARLHERWQAHGSPTTTYERIEHAIAAQAPDIQLPPAASALTQKMLDSVGGDIDKLYSASEGIPKTYLQRHTAADYLFPKTLDEINTAASKLRDQIVANGGAKGITSSSSDAINPILQRAGQPALTEAELNAISSAVEDANDLAKHTQNNYARLPSAAQIKDMNSNLNTLLKRDPEVSAKFFVAAAHMNENIAVAGVAEAETRLGTGNISYTAGEGKSIHPSISTTWRAEAGIGNKSLALTNAMRQQLQLELPRNGVGGGLYVESSTVAWAGVEETRTINRLGAHFTNTQQYNTQVVFTEVGVNIEKQDGLPLNKKATTQIGIKF